MSPILILCALSAQTPTDLAPGSSVRSSTTATEVAPSATIKQTASPRRYPPPLRIDGPGGPDPAPVNQPAVTPKSPSSFEAGGPEPSLDVPTNQKTVPNLRDQTTQSETTKAYLRTEGERQVSNGKIMLYIGIPLAVVGTLLGVGGLVTASNGRNPGGSGAAILGGLVLGSAGGGGIIAGSILLHRGRKKIEQGQKREPTTVSLSFRF